jgi:hypothetical protein
MELLRLRRHRHFLEFLFVTRVHKTCGEFPTFFGEPLVLQNSLHDAIPQKHQSGRLTLSRPRATVVRWRLAILQSLISAYLSGGVFGGE